MHSGSIDAAYSNAEQHNSSGCDCSFEKKNGVQSTISSENNLHSLDIGEEGATLRGPIVLIDIELEINASRAERIMKNFAIILQSSLN